MATSSPSQPEQFDAFLCYSDSEIDFVHQLHVDLRRHNISSSFEKEYQSFSQDAHCRVAVLVFSPDFFNGENKRPMVEFVKIVQEQKKGNLHILALFYLISIRTLSDQLMKDELNTKRKEMHGEEWSKMYYEELKEAVKSIKSINGVNSSVDEANYTESKINEVDYRECIVNEVVVLLQANPSFDVSHVEGRDRLCSEVDELFKNGRKGDGVKVLGLHGIEGCGKTTICKCLCNFYKSDFNNKVFHLEFGSQTTEQTRKLLLKVVAPDKVLSNEDQEWDILQERLKEHKVFIALDNADDKYMTVKSYLELSYKEGSKIIVTSRQASLFKVGSDEIRSLHVPRLKEDEATNILLNGKLVERKELSSQEEEKLREFAKKCIISDAYNPSALKKMCGDLCAMFGSDPTKWVEIPNLVDLHSVHYKLNSYRNLMTSYLEIGKTKPALYLGMNFLFARIFLNDLLDIHCRLVKNFLLQLLDGTESKGLIPFLMELLNTDECKQLLNGSENEGLTSIMGEVLNSDFKELLTGDELKNIGRLLGQVLFGN